MLLLLQLLANAGFSRARALTDLESISIGRNRGCQEKIHTTVCGWHGDGDGCRIDRSIKATAAAAASTLCDPLGRSLRCTQTHTCAWILVPSRPVVVMVANIKRAQW